MRTDPADAAYPSQNCRGGRVLLLATEFSNFSSNPVL